MFSFTPGSYDLKPSNVPESHTFKQHHKWLRPQRRRGPLQPLIPTDPAVGLLSLQSVSQECQLLGRGPENSLWELCTSRMGNGGWQC